MTFTITPTTATATGLDVRPLSGTIGAEIRGVDLKQPLDDATVDAIRAQLLRYHVVFFQGQHLSPDEHVAFGRYFGELTPAHPVIPSVDGYPELFEIDYQRTARLRATYGDVAHPYDGLSWHTDVTFVERPPLGSILNAVVIPPTGGDTMFSDQQAAYADLSPALRDFLDGLTAVHDGRRAFAPYIGDPEKADVEWEGELYTAIQPVEHPVVRTHPETGAKSLYVNPGFTSHIKGLAPAESDALLAFLYAHATKAKYTVRYHWQAGDLGFWDNRATQHSVVGDFADQPRVIQRVTIRGDKPV